MRHDEITIVKAAIEWHKYILRNKSTLSKEEAVLFDAITEYESKKVIKLPQAEINNSGRFFDTPTTPAPAKEQSDLIDLTKLKDKNDE